MKNTIRLFGVLLIILTSYSCGDSVLNYEKEKKNIEMKNGILLYKNKPYSGELMDSKNRVKTTYVDGIENGKYLTYHENGKIESDKNMKNGKLEGKCVIYDKNGNKTDEGYYVNGERDGEWIHYFISTGNRDIFIWKNGKIIDNYSHPEDRKKYMLEEPQ